MPATHVLALASAVALVACTGNPDAPAPIADGVSIVVAPLDLPGVAKVCYDLRVTNAAGRAGDTVWALGAPGLNGGAGDADALCSDRYGNGAGGDVAYVGACDASGQLDGDPAGERMNSVTIWFDGLYATGGGYLAPDGPEAWQDPAPAAARSTSCAPRTPTSP